MKNFVLAIIGACALVCSASAQSSLFNRYDVNMNKWAQLPADLPWGGETTWVAADGKGQVIVMVRAAPYFRVFTTDGKFVRAWGDAPLFKEAHAAFFDHEGNLWGVDTNDHVIDKFDADGKIVMTIGTRGVTGDNTSHTSFNRPATVAFGKNGDIFVADGYINSRVVQFDKNGKFIRIIGGVKGSGPGQMQTGAWRGDRFERPYPCQRQRQQAHFPFLTRTANSSKPGQFPAAAASPSHLTTRSM